MSIQPTQVAIQPLVGWPHEAEQDKTYLITVDVRLAADATWPYEQEEYPIYCALTAGLKYSVRSLGTPALLLHRFGGTYGPARFLLTALEPAEDSGLRLSFLNRWGMPILGVPLPMRIVSAAVGDRQETVVQLDRSLRIPQEPETATAAPPAPEVAPPPDDAHCELVLRQMVQDGDLVPWLGSRLAERGTESGEGPVLPPNAEDLAEELAKLARTTFPRLDLPQIAQYVRMIRGEPALHRWLRRILTADYEPGPAHRFLARFPKTLESLGLKKQYQLIVNANFDTTLEQAFNDEGEPYDLAVYMASGQDRGKFVHFSAGRPPVTIVRPNAYTDFPILSDNNELTRTVIVKIHGTTDVNVGDYHWTGDNYVITEDDYIGYLSERPVEGVVPAQIIAKLRESNCLFFGYTMRDWTQRVFLHRIWPGNRFGVTPTHWAVKHDADAFEQRFWEMSGVSLYRNRVADYVERLDSFLREHRDELT